MSEDTIFSMNVSVKTSPGYETLQPRDLKAEDLGNYIVLREILDRFQHNMVTYFLAGVTAEERAKRGEEIRMAIKDIPNPVWAENPDPWTQDSDCPSGQRCVNGVCTGTSNSISVEAASTTATYQATGCASPKRD